MKKQHATLLVAVAMCGCLDVGLLDEVWPMDAGEEAPADQGEDNGGAGTDGEDGPPAQDTSDSAPPQLSAPECAASEQAVGQACVAAGPVSASLRFSTDEPASVSVVAVQGMRGGVLSEEWSNAHHVAVADIGSDIETTVSIELVDVNGNKSSFQVPVKANGGAAVAITEVLADPIGLEPDQEFVEIANLSGVQMDLSGWSIDDGGDFNGDPIPQGTILDPGRIGILVPTAYNPADGQDPSPDPAALVVYLESSIGSSGLKNSEAESIELYDAQGVLVSQYRGQAGPPVQGAGAVRMTAELPDGDPLAFIVDPNGTSTPGRAPTLP